MEQRTRRSFLGTLAAGGAVTVAGCLDGESVSVLSAGSLARTFEDHVGPTFEDETGISVHGEYYGTNAVMRMIEDRTKHPDVVVSADAKLLRDRLYGEFADWDLEFATNSLGLGYSEETTFGERLAADEPWYELALELEDGDISIGDPDLDPLGYRAVMAFELAEDHHGLEDFRRKMVDAVYREPEEPQMMAGVESGTRAGAIVYRNMAVDHGLEFQEFPPEYNFAEPSLADHYATAEYTTDEEGYTAVGRPIVYNATVHDEADEPDAGHRLVQFLVDNPSVLEEAGLRVPAELPRSTGTLPEAIHL